MNDPNGPQNPMARQSGIVVLELPDEVLVYDMDTNKAHCLNHSAALVWKSCDGSNSIMDIVRQFESDGRGKVTEDFVWLAIDQLNENGLLENNPSPRFQRRTRRQMLKTIGLASTVAVPIIASLIGPPRALGTTNCSCTNNAQCATMTGCPSLTNCNALGLCGGPVHHQKQ